MPAEADLIVCMWTCHRCKQERVKCEVRKRMAGEGIIAFTNRVVARCGRQHAARSPKCPTRKLDVYLPVGEDGCAGTGGEPTAETIAAVKRAVDERFPPKGDT